MNLVPVRSFITRVGGHEVAYRVDSGSLKYIAASNGSRQAVSGQRCNGPVAFYIPGFQRIVKLPKASAVSFSVSLSDYTGAKTHLSGTVQTQLSNFDRTIQSGATKEKLDRRAHELAVQSLLSEFAAMRLHSHNYLDNQQNLQNRMQQSISRKLLDEVGYSASVELRPYTTVGNVDQYVRDIQQQLQCAANAGYHRGYGEGQAIGYTTGYVTAQVTHQIINEGFKKE